MDNKRDGVNWQEWAAKLFVILAVLGVAYLFMSTVLKLLLPFLLACLLAAIIRPCAAWLERKCKLPRKVGAIFLLLLLLVLLSVLVFLGCERLMLEIQKLAAHMGSNGELWGQWVGEAWDVVTRLTAHIPFLTRLTEQQSLSAFWTQVDAKIAEIVSDTLTRWSARIPDMIAAFARGIPSAIVFVLTFLLAAFYCCADGTKITQAVLGWLPENMRRRFPEGRERLFRVGGRYLRAYFLLFLLTFAELFIGFTVLRLPYTFLPALIIALVDILPVLGVWTVLVPCGVIELLRGNIGLGSGLLILCGIMLLLRQFSEPRIIGESLGLHPLATLFAAYVGLQLFGLFGMLLGPAAALVIKSVLGQGTRSGQSG